MRRAVRSVDPALYGAVRPNSNFELLDRSGFAGPKTQQLARIAADGIDFWHHSDEAMPKVNSTMHYAVQAPVTD